MHAFAMCVTASTWFPKGTSSSMTQGFHIKTNAYLSQPVRLFLEAQPPDLGEVTGRVPV